LCWCVIHVSFHLLCAKLPQQVAGHLWACDACWAVLVQRGWWTFQKSGPMSSSLLAPCWL
jgi:hypothetical protein